MGLIIAWRLAIVLIVVQPLIIMCFYTRYVMLKSIFRKARKEQGDSTKLANENYYTILIPRPNTKMAQKGSRKPTDREYSSCIKNSNWSLNCWYGRKFVSQGYISPRQVFQTIIILMSTSRIIIDTGSMITDLARGWDAIIAVFKILDNDTKIEPENEEGYMLERIISHVELCNVHFSYTSRPDVLILKGFSINIEARKSMALVRKSGSR
ncbi:ABC-transporter [Parasponia andersonii]|uniref:ABC-transporter n=1 Tax=Parasponia andersonii TaxID=3476 RepID=A0A2P5AAH4_PARAD|nr:ABC-transporter [Parasponia andersonii]